MHFSRRDHLKSASLLGGLVATGAYRPLLAAEGNPDALVISTWDHGVPANAAALATLASGGTALDAAEKGVMVVEADPNNRSVGLGGTPDRDGIVTLDASIMDHDSRAGSVAFVSTVAVEAMRHGASPQEACEEAIRRIIRKHQNHRDFQVGILAVNVHGVTGAHSMHQGFTYALSQPTMATELKKASHTLQ